MSFPYGSTVDGYLAEFLSYYNGGAYDATGNPGGLAEGGHRVNFVPILQKYSVIASSVADAANYAETQATKAGASANEAAAAVNALTGTSTSSVTIGTGPKSFTTQTGKLFDVGTFVQVVSAASPSTHYMVGQVLSYITDLLTIDVDAGAFGGSGIRSDWTIYGRAGPLGPGGPVGATGATGITPAMQWNFSTSTADSDPGEGLLRINAFPYSAATFLYIDDFDRFAAAQDTFLGSLSDSTNSVHRGTIFLQQIDTPSTYALFSISGSPGVVEDGIGYWKVPVTHIASNGTFSSAAALALVFSRSGDKGLDGLGTGDVLSDIGSSTVGRLALFNSTDGKHITQAAVGIGTSGSAVPRLDTANTWGAAQSIAAKLDAQQDIALSGDITPAQITSNQNDYAPAGGATSSVWRLSTDARREITGFANGVNGRMLVTANVGSFDLVFRNLTTSSASNQLQIAGGDLTLTPGHVATWRYDGTLTKWLLLASTATAISSQNFVYNSAFQIIQRSSGPFAIASNAFTFDRWRATRFGTAGLTVSRQTALAGSGGVYEARIQRDSGNVSTEIIAFSQALSNLESRALAGKTITVSADVTGGANFSGASSGMTCRIITGTGTEESGGDAMLNSSWTGAVNSDTTWTISTTRARYTKTYAVPSNATELGFAFFWAPVGTAGAADYFQIANIKLEVGAVATPFELPHLSQEYDRCASYYEDMARDPFIGIPILRVISDGKVNSTGGAEGTPQYFWATIRFKTKRKRDTTLTLYNGLYGMDTMHVTAIGGTSYWFLITQAWGHNTHDDALYMFYYTIDTPNGRPALTNNTSVALALDGGANSKFAIDCEI